MKFAKSEPAPNENETSFDKVVEFLKAMKQAADEASASGEAEKTDDAKSEAEASGKAE